jgi:NAD-dependent deacetylase
VHVARQRGIRRIYIGPEAPLNADAFDDIRLGPATELVPQLLPFAVSLEVEGTR